MRISAIIFALLLAAGGYIWRIFKGPGRKPLSPIMRFRYRGKTKGEVEKLNADGVTVGYEVSGIPYHVTAPLRREVRRAALRSPRAAFNDVYNMPDDWRTYETTNLGDLRLGGRADVRYDLKNPAGAVIVPNPHRFHADARQDG